MFDPDLSVGSPSDLEPRVCQGCGCDDAHACCEGMANGVPIPCRWVTPDLCSKCVTLSEIAYAHATGRFYAHPSIAPAR